MRPATAKAEADSAIRVPGRTPTWRARRPANPVHCDGYSTRLPFAAMPESSRLFLPRYILTAYLLLVVYASLYPFSGWRDQGVSPDAFLFAPMPRYFTIFDVAVNLAGYFPLGFLLVLAFNAPQRPVLSAAAAAVIACLLSVALEALQSYLPSRVASNLDVLCNSAGALCGAIAGALAAPTLLSSRMRMLRNDWLAPGPHTDLGLVVLGLWLLTQANPALLLFGNGDLRADLGLGLAPFTADGFRAMETTIVALNLVALGALATLVARERRFAWPIIAAMIALTLLAKGLASALLFKPENYLVWLTPGAQEGLTLGGLALLLVPWLPRGVLAMFAVALLGAAVVMVNLVPENPYHTAILPQWQQGQFLNFNGATGAVALLWPFGAMAWAVASGVRPGGRGLAERARPGSPGRAAGPGAGIGLAGARRRGLPGCGDHREEEAAEGGIAGRDAGPGAGHAREQGVLRHRGHG